jgi:HSP20 family protein
MMRFLFGLNEEGRAGAYYPALDVVENEGNLCIEMEIPGVNPDNVDIAVLGRTLTISGRKEDLPGNKGLKYLRMERSFGNFRRNLEIPERFDLEKINAKFKDGVLIIKIKRAEVKPDIIKRINIE